MAPAGARQIGYAVYIGKNRRSAAAEAVDGDELCRSGKIGKRSDNAADLRLLFQPQLHHSPVEARACEAE